jgi:hypothetical protein
VSHVQAETNGKFVWISTSTEKLCFETERVADAKFLCRAIEYLMQASPSTSHISPSHSSGAVESMIKSSSSTLVNSSSATTTAATGGVSHAVNSGSTTGTSSVRTAREIADEQMAAAAAAAAAADR